MSTTQAKSSFEAVLYQPDKPNHSWAFVLIPKEASDILPRRGRTTVVGTVNEHPFQSTLEPDGQLSHWLKVEEDLREAAKISVGDTVRIELSPIENEPEPILPPDFEEALEMASEAKSTWDSTTTIARLDWIHWLESAKRQKTRQKRIQDACQMLAEGKKRVCCFDPSGHYSKAFKPPKHK